MVVKCNVVGSISTFPVTRHSFPINQATLTCHRYRQTLGQYINKQFNNNITMGFTPSTSTCLSVSIKDHSRRIIEASMYKY